MSAKPHQRIAMIARWRPVHVGQVAVLRALCEMSDVVKLGIGSSNKYNARNPFTLEETEDMLRLVLEEIGVGRVGLDTSGASTRSTRPAVGVEIIPVPDLDDGPRWRVMVREMFGELDLFVTDNPYVANLMKEFYPIARPVDLIPPGERVRVDGSMVRARMARGEGWQEWVTRGCAAYIESRGLDERFRREFGLQTLAMETVIE